jgi:hypothetical protein
VSGELAGVFELQLNAEEPGKAVLMAETEAKSGGGGTLAVVVARVVVPAWFAAGAILKLVDLSPTHLPAAIIKFCGVLGIDLMFVLRFSVAAELIVAAVMVFVPPLARWTGLVMLGVFLPVLMGDLALGASSCGCFGAVNVSPWVSLVMDVTFFLVLAYFGRREPRLAITSHLPTTRVVTAGALSLLSVVVAFGPRASGSDPAGQTTTDLVAGLPEDGYYLPDYESWRGRPFRDLEIAAWIVGLNADLETGQQYVVFYRKDCEHCHELLEVYFSGALQLPTTAVAVPERNGWPTENLQPFPCTECRLAELPSGIDWFLQTPVLVRLSDGIVECAAEVDPGAPECLLW